MRIGIDASTWFNGRGFGRFTRELIQAMLIQDSGHSLVLFFDQPAPPGVGGETIQVRQQEPVTQAAVADRSRSPIDMLRFTRAVSKAGLDVMFYPAVYSWFPCPLTLPNVVTLHDAIAERFPQMVFPEKRSRIMWMLKVRLACLQADRFMTVSHAARQEIVRYLKLDESRVDIATEGPGSAFRPLTRSDKAAAKDQIRKKWNLPDTAQYFCYVGGFSPHKNVTSILKAFDSFVAAGTRDVHLLLVGDMNSHGFSSNIASMRAQIAGSPHLTQHVHWIGFIDDESLARIYATSLALVMPSLSEGFGLPAVESMACGTPVIASTEGALPEIVGDAGIIVQPLDTHGIAAAMRGFAQDRGDMERLRVKALARASSFTWSQAAIKTLDILERCHRMKQP